MEISKKWLFLDQCLEVSYSWIEYLKAYYPGQTVVGEGLRKCILTENFKIVELSMWLEFRVS